MPGVHPTQINDFLVDTLDKFHNKGRFQTYFTENNYFGLDEVFTQDTMKVQSGSQITWFHVFGDTQNFRHANLMEPRGTRNIQDLLSETTVPWKYGDVEAYYQKNRVTMNEGAEQKVDYVKTQYYGALKSACDGIEQRMYKAPATNATTDKTPWGIPYWIRMSDSAVTTNGFNGKTIRYEDGNTSTTIAGINASNEAKARNWCGIRSTQLIDTIWTIDEGLTAAKITPPKTLEQYVTQRSKKYRCLLSNTDFNAYKKLLSAGPDDRNGDINPFGNQVTMHGLRLVNLTWLDGVTYSPIYVMDFNKFKPVVHRDYWFQRGEPFALHDPRDVTVVPWDFQYNYIAEDLRYSGFVVHTAIA